MVSVGIVVGIFYTLFMTPTTNPKTLYYVLGGGIVLGIVVGWILMKYPKIGAGLAAGVGGYIGGTLIYALLLGTLPAIVKYIVGAICAGLAVWISKKTYDPVIITSTAGIGAYALVIGVSTYLGHWYGVSEVVSLLMSGQVSSIDPFYWLYVAALVGFVTGGILY